MPINSVFTRKSLGILLHPTCLPGGYECGTFGKNAKDWIKKLSNHGISYWQFLPLTPTDNTGSPYSSPSSFALNPWFIDINELIEKNFIVIPNNKELGKLKTNNKNFFDFEVANNLSREIEKYLINSWQSQSEQRQNEFHDWIENNSWVEDYSIFM